MGDAEEGCDCCLHLRVENGEGGAQAKDSFYLSTLLITPTILAILLASRKVSTKKEEGEKLLEPQQPQLHFFLLPIASSSYEGTASRYLSAHDRACIHGRSIKSPNE
jgi:hypothetical protein